MSKTTIYLAIYNEIRFIQKTLESLVGEADCIIIGDNASTDGTSEICQDFASRYPEIEYYRHEENLGAEKNTIFVTNKVRTEYSILIGGHDLIDKGSIRHWAKILDENPAYAFAGPEIVTNLNPDYSVRDICEPNNFDGELFSDNKCIRVRCSIGKFGKGSEIYGLFRHKSFIEATKLMPYLVTDHGFHAELAREGKFYLDKEHTFYQMYPRALESRHEHQLRVLKTATVKKEEDINLWGWHFSIIAGAYALAEDMVKKAEAEPQFIDELMDIVVKRFGPTHFSATLDKMDIKPENQELVNTIFSEVLKRKKLYFKKVSIIKRVKKKLKQVFLDPPKIKQTRRKIHKFFLGLFKAN